jgi:two-component system, NarL family, nitrate/nitrite response regulator NarL
LKTNKTGDPIRIVLLDNLALVRAGIRSLIENQPGMELVGEAGDFDEAIRIVEDKKPDIILLELSQAGNLGLEVIPQLIHCSSSTRLILVTRSSDPNIYIKAVQNGVLGVVLKTQPPEVLLKAIRKVHAGEAWIERSMVASLLINISRNLPALPTDPEAERIARLNQRERDIVQLIGRGLKTRQIASQLFISETTVRHYLTSIYEKLGVSERLELLIFAHRVGMTNLSNLPE